MSDHADKSTALWVVRVLRGAGHQALFAGGCVRDMLLGVRSTDYDVATDATPQQVRRLFRRVLLVGAKFGVAMVIVRRRRVEVTTFRSEESYSDGRRPDHVKFTSPHEDAKRRDFTINGMFYDPIAREVIDYVNGRVDLQAGVIRTIGNPEDRFGEDYLRMIRAVRFAVRLGFRIDQATAQAVRHHAPQITAISGERIFDELSKMLTRPTAPQALSLLAELGLAREILPASLNQPQVWERSLARVAAVAAGKDLPLTLAALLAELPRQVIVQSLRRWGAPNEIRDGLCWMAVHLNDWPTAANLSLADFKRLLADRNFGRLRTLWRVQERRQTGKLTHSRRIVRRANLIPPERVAPPPFITGADLKALGLTEGPKLGQLLKTLYEAQLNEQVANRKEAKAMAIELLRTVGKDQKD